MLKFYHGRDIPDNWQDRYVQLWQEDDATLSDPSATKIEDAIVMFAGGMYLCAKVFTPSDEHGVYRPLACAQARRILGDALAEVDYGDCVVKLYADGWVIASSYDGQSLGRVLVDET
jgi:hypothetical protein